MNVQTKFVNSGTVETMFQGAIFYFIKNGGEKKSKKWFQVKCIALLGLKIC